MTEPPTRELLKRLVAFDTTSRRSNLRLVEAVKDWLERHGVASRRVYDATGTKANLFATIGPDRPDGIILSGHVDTVPVDHQNWTGDPFQLREQDGRLFGRGTTDMKGFDAVVLAKVPAMAKADLARPIHLALSYDEEVGCLGVRTLLQRLQTEGFKAAGCVVGEPTNMAVVLGHKGKHSFEVEVTGAECHSAMAPMGVNAVEYAARLVTRISDIGRRLAAEGPLDPAYTVPHTTAHVGSLKGGTALNIVPDACRFVFEFRHLTSQPAEPLVAEVERFARAELEPAMRAVHAAAGVRFTRTSRVPGFDIAADHELVRTVARLAGHGVAGKVAFGTEAGLFTEWLGVPSVVCGPGDIAQAHKPDEFVTAAQLQACERFVDRLIDACARPA
ncbi:MAG: acetylornithine deacetylase [Alphaproteobacteria bacterium]